eukprot:scaffold8672_cov50-Attheya_sp.AAC.6
MRIWRTVMMITADLSFDRTKARSTAINTTRSDAGFWMVLLPTPYLLRVEHTRPRIPLMNSYRRINLLLPYFSHRKSSFAVMLTRDARRHPHPHPLYTASRIDRRARRTRHQRSKHPLLGERIVG